MGADLRTIVQQGWSTHAEQPESVKTQLGETLDSINTEEQFQMFAGLWIHVVGGHLKDWDACLQALAALTDKESLAGLASVKRAQAVATYCAELPEADALLSALAPDDKSRVYANASSELTTNGLAKRASIAFNLALESAGEELTAENPTARALAISGNNLAAELEEKAELDSDETELMLKAATAARKYWAIAGGWMETERAEYRLAMSHLKAGQFEQASFHAVLCEKICHENGDDPTELFFAHEAQLRIQAALCKHYKALVPEDMKAYCTAPTIQF